ncbi:hemerythrin domain-containing protein [Polyangium aurulentum]|uniref:hemerythrin domain-containing protein n=1 Tax=Polyangium aurulentum TaxID=2567896 RepID=UPI0010AE6FA0|nr:hemerythrin domain-containing protein [Polyangium aurulentum]UQA56021.1 hemerythrin domain-containing protein [Polyangium aurulentum]
MDALDLLEQQHRDVRDRLERLAAAPDLVGRQAELIDALRAVEAHVRAEETYLYAKYSARLSDESRIESALAEHAFIRAAARELASAHADGPLFAARLQVLSDRFARHAEDEEDWVFPKLKRSLTDEELDVIGSDLDLAFNFFKEAGWAPVRALRPLPRTAASARGNGVARSKPRATVRAKSRVRGSAARAS